MSSASSTFVSGGSPTAAQANGWEQGTLGYAQVVANQTGIVAPTDLTGLTVTVTVVAGRRIRITAQITAQNSSAAVLNAMTINEGATILNKGVAVSSTAALDTTLNGSAILTPTAGSHTYKLQGDRSGGTMQLSASATQPSFILVEDIGAV